MIMINKQLLFGLLIVLLGFLFFPQLSVQATCSGTPTTCGSLIEGSCVTCGCGWTVARCNNNGTCGSCADQTACNNCSCASCSWGGTSCPWIGSWNGDEWILEHEAFPFAIFQGSATTTYDGLPNLKCIDGEVRVKIYEGLQERTFLQNFSVFKGSNIDGWLKPDLEGRPRIIQERIIANRCLSSSEDISSSCLSLISEADGVFYEPTFDYEKIDDWLVLEFDEIVSDSPKLYLRARKQALLTTYYEYMVHSLGSKNFSLFNKISNKKIISDLVNNWWENNLKMQIEVWSGENWEKQGSISAGYHMPGSGADDFLVSLKKIDKQSNALKVRLRFITGGFGIDYVFLDQTVDPEFSIAEILPNQILFNNFPVSEIAPREMVYDDMLVMTYDCESQDQFYISTTGYYLPEIFPPERQKSSICSWLSFWQFFTKDKEHVIKNAYDKGLYKQAPSLDYFTTEELANQQQECFWLYFFLTILVLLLIAISLFLYKRKYKKIFIVFITFSLIIFLLIGRAIFVKATASCQGTLNCSNCSQVNCQNCTQCSWVPGNCGGTPSVCSSHTTEANCTSCGCTWTQPPISISLDTDGVIDFGAIPLESTKSAGPEVVRVDSGPADLLVKSTNFTHDANTWTLGGAIDTYVVKWEYSLDSSTWSTFLVADDDYSFDSNVATDATRNLYLRINTPTDSVSNGPYGATVTILAVTP